MRTFPWDTLIVFFVSMAVIFSLRFLWYACWGLNRAPRPILSKNIQKRLLVYLCEKREDCGCSTSPQVDIIDLGNDQAFCEQIQSILHQARYRGTLYTKSPVVYGEGKFDRGVHIVGMNPKVMKVMKDALLQIGLKATVHRLNHPAGFPTVIFGA